MAAQLALLDAQGQRLFQQRGRGERGQQLGVEQALHQRHGRGQVAHAPGGRQDLGEAAHVDAARQAVEHRQARGVPGGDVAVGVVFHHIKAVALRQLQHLVRAPGREAVAGGVVQHAHADEQLGRVQLAVARHDLQVRPFGAARHGQHAHAQRVEPGELDRPARLLHHHRVARLEQGAAHDVQRLRGAHRGHHLRGRGGHAQVLQAVRQRGAQRGRAQRVAVTQQAVL